MTDDRCAIPACYTRVSRGVLLCRTHQVALPEDLVERLQYAAHQEHEFELEAALAACVEYFEGPNSR